MSTNEVRVAPAAALLQMFEGVDGPTSYACLEVIRRLRSDASTRLSLHQIGLILDDLEVGVLEEDVLDALVRTGAFQNEAGTLRLTPTAKALYVADTGVTESVLAEEVIDLLEGTKHVDILPSVSPSELPRCVARVGRWAQSLLAHATERDLPGFPVFWQRDEERSVPLGLDVGSMASVDTAALLLEPARYGWPVDLAAADLASIARAWRYVLDLGIDSPGDWYDGAIFLPQFDDDFVGSFLPAQAKLGSCPATEAIANRIIGLLTMVRAIPDADKALVLKTIHRVEAAVGCLGRWQLDSGGWAIHRYEGDVHQLAPRDVSCQYAAEALVEVLRWSVIPETLRCECLRQLRRFADFIIANVHTDACGSWWDGDFVVTAEHDQLRTTTLLGLVLGRVAQELADSQLIEIQGLVVRYIQARWDPKSEQVFESTFRSPTWDGPALTSFTWDMVHDGFILVCILDWDARGGVLDTGTEEKLLRAIEGIIHSEYFGAWLDVPMFREGKRRAFVSNSLHNLRGVLSASAWIARSFPTGIGPGW